VNLTIFGGLSSFSGPMGENPPKVSIFGGPTGKTVESSSMFGGRKKPLKISIVSVATLKTAKNNHGRQKTVFFL
jgi:hypothetical protein